MRIIGGTHRGRPILPPRGRDTTRPITDRVKQSLFDRLWAMGLLADEAEDEHVLDLFSGTGSLGLEALSRQAAHCTFVENNRSAAALLEQNLADLMLTDRATVLHDDVLGSFWLGLVPADPLTVIFCDPPYALTRDAATCGQLVNQLAHLAQHTEPGGALMIRTDGQSAAPAIDGWKTPQSHRYGSTVLNLYDRAN